MAANTKRLGIVATCVKCSGWVPYPLSASFVATPEFARNLGLDFEKRCRCKKPQL